MTMYEQEEKLFEEWSRRRSPFVSDGSVSENDYQTSSQKIAFILNFPLVHGLLQTCLVIALGYCKG